MVGGPHAAPSPPHFWPIPEGSSWWAPAPHSRLRLLGAGGGRPPSSRGALCLAARGPPQRPLAQFPRMQGWLGTQLGPSSVLMPALCPALWPTVTSAPPVPALESHLSLRGSCMSAQPMGTWGPWGALPPTTGPRCVDICADGPRGGRRRPGLWPDSQSPFMRGNLAPKTTAVAPQTRGARGACPVVLFLLQGLLAPGQVQGQPS